MRTLKAMVVAIGLLGLCVLLSAKDVWGFNSPLDDDLNIDTFTLALAGVAQATLAYFVYRQIAGEDRRERTRLAHEKAMVIADFLAACTNVNALYHQTAHLAKAYIENHSDPERRAALQNAIDAVEPARQTAHAQKVRLLAWTDEDLKSDALALINHIDGQRRKAVKCVSWLDRFDGTPPVTPDPDSIRSSLPDSSVERMQALAAASLSESS